MSSSGSLDNRSISFVLRISDKYLRIYTDISIGYSLLRSVIHIQSVKTRQQNIAIGEKEHIERTAQGEALVPLRICDKGRKGLANLIQWR